MTDDRIVGTYIGRYDDGHAMIRLSSMFDEIETPDPSLIDINDSDNEYENMWLRAWATTFSSTDWSRTSHAVKRQQKAKEFLKSWLTNQEYEDLQDGNLIIPSKIFPDRTYKLKGSASQMVEVYTSGILDHKLCAVAKDPRFENDDTVLAKILMLKTNEEQFLKIAEKHEIHLDSGFGRHLTYFLAGGNTDNLTLTWDLTGEISLRTGSSIQPSHNDNN